MLWRQLRWQVAFLAGRLSSDRSSLDALIRLEDLPDGWFQNWEKRWRFGLTSTEELARRSRQAKLVGATRCFELVGTGTWVMASAVPFVSVEDAQDWLEISASQVLSSRDRDALAHAETEVAPPRAAGEHARAVLVNTDYESGPRRTHFFVAWREAQPMVFTLQIKTPTEYDVLDPMTMLIQL